MQGRVVTGNMARYTWRRDHSSRGGCLMAIKTKGDRDYVARLNSFREALGSLRLSEGTSALLAERDAEREGRTAPGQRRSISPKVNSRSTAKPATGAVGKAAAKVSAKKASVTVTQTGPRVAAAMKTAGSRKPTGRASGKKR